MKDRDFKVLSHACENYTVYSSGKEIEKNYSPDYVLRSDNDFIIIEHETEPNRKTIVADLFKAAYFLRNNRKGILVIVMTPKGKSSFESYPKHVFNYYKWLKKITNLENVVFVQETQYYDSKTLISINSENFNKNSISLNELKL